MEVCWLVSGETLAVLPIEEVQGLDVRGVKAASLAPLLGVSRFCLQLFAENGSKMNEDEVFSDVPGKVQLVILEFWPADADEDQKMIVAARNNQTAVLEDLLLQPRSPNVQDPGGKWPLHHAVPNGHVQCVKLLLEARAETDARTRMQMTPLMMAVFRSQLEVAQLLLEAMADPNLVQEDGITPLHFAALKGSGELLRLLLEAKANQDTVLADGKSALHFAATEGHLEVVQTLLEAGAEKDRLTTDGQTALQMAAMHGKLEVVKWLVAAGADHHYASKGGISALSLATLKGEVDMVRFLVEASSDPQEQLGLAASQGQLEVLRLLLELGARCEPNQAEPNALEIAAAKGQAEIVSFLEGWMEKVKDEATILDMP